MPTENRSSNTQMAAQLSPCPHCGQQDAFVEQLDSDASVVICQGRIDEHSACLARGPVGVQQHECEDQPGYDQAVKEWNKRAAAVPHPDPIAWMVGTAFWWTKEEAERDAAETGLPIVGLGPMTATGPAEQKHREPVAWVRFRNGEPDYDGDAVMISNVRGDTLGDGDSWEPVYTHADPGEVERLRSIERSYGLREALLEQVKGERDRMIARTMELSGQLADQDALLQKLKETLQREYWDEYAGLDETRELIAAALSASQEPSTPAAPYPNRLCHIDYTAHPHRCGCLKGDEESQRIYDEHCRTDLARQP
ncbi:Lar family restriction alleviation protein [Pseudomonas putida]|nr:Lar family restriction alleviation protein [Pseudomonas putida]MDD2001490.1 Lar family restriction alleviation protein [Pseudomonas putida]HDS1791580.1 Lar family restriction alleviation protein [Pseudomonas putida]